MVLPANNSAQYSAVAEKMMSNMGYEAGNGLGKNSQGILEPIFPYVKAGKGGIGYTLKDANQKSDKVNETPTEDNVNKQFEEASSNKKPSNQGYKSIRLRYYLFWVGD